MLGSNGEDSLMQHISKSVPYYDPKPSVAQLALYDQAEKLQEQKVFTMSQLNDFLVQIPDKPNMLSTRFSNRDAHMARSKGLIEAGTIVMGGPTLASHPKNADEGLAITGSALLIRAATESDVRALISDDPYAKLGVWDIDNATITPYMCAVRKPL
ncbi:hypothetical protein AAE478_002883 [Parahypoxylon ruwenzoriense]